MQGTVSMRENFACKTPNICFKLFYSNLLFCSNIRCPQFTSLPQGCVLVKPTGQCCAQPQCTGGTGTGTGTMTGTGTGTMTGTGTGTGTMTGIIYKCINKHCIMYSYRLATEQKQFQQHNRNFYYSIEIFCLTGLYSFYSFQ